MAENNLGEIFEKIASNPDIIEKITSITQGNENTNTEETLSKIMEAISPIVKQEKSDESGEKSDTPLGKTENRLFSLPLGKIGEKITKNAKLLIALKPYLSPERSDIIDTVVKIAQVGDLMKLVK